MTDEETEGVGPNISESKCLDLNFRPGYTHSSFRLDPRVCTIIASSPQFRKEVLLRTLVLEGLGRFCNDPLTERLLVRKLQ